MRRSGIMRDKDLFGERDSGRKWRQKLSKLAGKLPLLVFSKNKQTKIKIATTKQRKGQVRWGPWVPPTLTLNLPSQTPQNNETPPPPPKKPRKQKRKILGDVRCFGPPHLNLNLPKPNPRPSKESRPKPKTHTHTKKRQEKVDLVKKPVLFPLTCLSKPKNVRNHF